MLAASLVTRCCVPCRCAVLVDLPEAREALVARCDEAARGITARSTLFTIYRTSKWSLWTISPGRGGIVRHVARPYGDPVEIVTAPIPAQSPFIPGDAKIVVGAVAPASPDPIPIVLLPAFEYRMREWRHPDTHEVHWLLERRKSAQYGEDDE